MLQMHLNFRSIMGFVTKTESQDMLMSKPNGTFLLRFSDSELGGITIAWVADQQDKGWLISFDVFCIRLRF